MDEIENGISEILGYDLIDSEIKNKIIKNPKLEKDINKWVNKYVQNRESFGVKECNLTYIDYNSLNIDEIEDEIELKEITKKIKQNDSLCPTHRSCPLFCNNLIQPGMQCVLEKADASVLKKALSEELDIKSNEYNDIINIDNLISIYVINNRALRALSAEPLVETIKTYSKNGIQFDKKINDNFIIFEKTQALSERVRKALVLDRRDKLKIKELENSKTKEQDDNELKETLSQFEQDIDMAEVIDIVNAEQTSDLTANSISESIKNEKQHKKNKTNENELSFDINIEG